MGGIGSGLPVVFGYRRDSEATNKHAGVGWTMGLILYGLRKFGEAVGGIAIACAIYLSLQILVAFWGSLRDSLPNPMKTVEQLRSELASKVEELEALQKELSSRFGNVVNFERRIQELERSRPQWVTIWPPGTHIAQRSKHDLELKSLRTAKAKAVQAHGEMLQRQRQLEQHINRLQQQIANTLATPAGRVASIIQTHWLAGVLFGVGIFIVPMLTRAGWFYVVAPVASAAKPVRLANASQRLGPVSLPVLTCSSSTKKLDLTISPNESLFVRAAWLKSYDANTKKSTRPAWKLSSPFISYSAGLLAPTRVDGGSEGAKVSLWNGEDADRQLACVELRDHPGIVLSA